jgi:hypothetical protein
MERTSHWVWWEAIWLNINYIDLVMTM